MKSRIYAVLAAHDAQMLGFSPPGFGPLRRIQKHYYFVAPGEEYALAWLSAQLDGLNHQVVSVESYKIDATITVAPEDVG